ncbi:MAG: F0F1 ATP synthase subunit A [Desulfobulbaceae bacterium]|jgi:F-type H+-transporting ATPase subunit a|nr:F0F1 ATP synthase subunit A [Desulfobulbaceae bacterium]
MRISPDSIIIWQTESIKLNATILFTWLVMILLVFGSRLVTRKLHTGEQLPRWQNLLESIVVLINGQIRDVTRQPPNRFLPFLGTLFLFIGVSNLLSVVPGFQPPTGSLSTTTGLAICVFIAVPAYGIADNGILGYLKNYIRPTPLMLPFNITGEISRTLALAVRLFGNVMSGTMIVAILLAISPLIFPVVMNLLGLLTGMVQAYIFVILAAVYIGAGLEVQVKGHKSKEE